MSVGLAGLAVALLMSASNPEHCKKINEAMLAMPLSDFDQGDGGWRQLDADGCEAVAADGIRQYRERNASSLDRDDTLIWHEAQLRASAGQADAAISLMSLARETDTPATRPYTDATIAFLRRDKEALLAAREQLLALPENPGFREAAQRYAVAYPNLPPLTWPLNLDVVDGLVRCFDKPYAEAYLCR